MRTGLEFPKEICYTERATTRVGFSIDAATYIVDGPYVRWYCNNGVCRVPDTATTEFAVCLEGPEKN